MINSAEIVSSGFGCAAHTVRKMSLRSPQSRRTYAGLRSWSLDRHQRPTHVLPSRAMCQCRLIRRHRSAKSGR
jgi:hypothetical protein